MTEYSWYVQTHGVSLYVPRVTKLRTKVTRFSASRTTAAPAATNKKPKRRQIVTIKQPQQYIVLRQYNIDSPVLIVQLTHASFEFPHAAVASFLLLGTVCSRNVRNVGPSSVSEISQQVNKKKDCQCFCHRAVIGG